MLNEKQLLRRANAKRPDPIKNRKGYDAWRRARIILGLDWKITRASK